MKTLSKWLTAGVLVTLAVLVVTAHGACVQATKDDTNGVVTVTAAYDTGEVLDGAQVVIFAPDDLANPWGTAMTDENGQYQFVPDAAILGFWEVQVREAGHGGSAYVEITAADAERVANVPSGDLSGQGASERALTSNQASDTGRSPTQMIGLSALVIAALSGIAWYYGPRRSANRGVTEQ